jgi:hypothetical protein
MNNFNFSEVPVTTTKPRFQPGIYENVMIMKVYDSETPNGKKIICVDLLGTKEEKFTASWSMEGGAVPYTMRKLKHMLTKVISEEQANAITSTEQVNKTLSGKQFRWKFIGQEYVNKEGQVRVKTDIGLPNFCENMKTTPTNQSALSFDPNNQYDMVKLPAEQVPSGNVAKADDMPF